MRIEPLQPKHIEAAAGMTHRLYREGHKWVCALPQEDFTQVFQRTISNTLAEGLGFAALEGEQLLGYLTGVPVASLHGPHPGVYCNAACHGTLNKHRELYGPLYERAADAWVKRGFLTHAITFFAHDKGGIDLWFHMGFGHRCADAIRPLDEVRAGHPPRGLAIRPAQEADAPALLPLIRESRAYYRRSPLFMYAEGEITPEEVRQGIGRRDATLWLALEGETPVAMMGCGEPWGESFVAKAPGTGNIGDTFVMPAYRNQGVGTALLRHVVADLRDRGFARCGVDYESANYLGSHFWQTHFTPYTYSLERRLDERYGR